eukprot:scaffold311682_cov26-Prasinocladus_malaysianus.AAC.2
MEAFLACFLVRVSGQYTKTVDVKWELRRMLRLSNVRSVGIPEGFMPTLTFPSVCTPTIRICGSIYTDNRHRSA